jgi:HD-GYP domain-containing protein (c-di-GMP phosphodiesterase class II)
MSPIVDTFGALTDVRFYKPVFPAEKAFASLENMDAAIDQNMLAVFMEIFSSTQNREKERDLVETV